MEILPEYQGKGLMTETLSEVLHYATHQLKLNAVEGFTQRYKLHDLIYFEVCPDMVSAICREKQLKAGSRAKKIKLIESVNPYWRDLYESI